MIVGNMCVAGGPHIPAKIEAEEEKELNSKLRTRNRRHTLNFCERCGSAYLTREVVKEGETRDDD